MRLLCSHSGKQRGFSMIEILVALAVFAIVSAAAFQLFDNHARYYSSQQDLTGVNLGLRNALTMIQLDVSNAGNGVFVGANVPSWPIGVTVQNSVAGGGGGGSCFDPATQTYTAACFDIMHVVAADPTVPPVHPTDIGANCVSTTSSTAFANPAPGETAAQTAAHFSAGDQLLFVKGDGSQMTSVILSQDGQPSGGKVQLQHNPTAADGSGGDPLFITNNPNNKLGSTFCDNDWVIKLRGITYRVNAANPNNPMLERWVGGVADVVADQIIGFKVGATLWNGASTSSEEYNYDSAQYDTDGTPGAPYSDPFDFTLIRSVRVSLIGRTRPNPDPTYTFRNTFDNGRYQILGASVVVNPRNLSMKD
ncbi:MAG: PilW family protein [Candidatus Acidiferrales bacterium]